MKETLLTEKEMVFLALQFMFQTNLSVAKK